MVHHACIDWEIPIETENAAALVVSELATNAVVHAETPLRAGVELSGEVLSSASATCVPTCRYASSPAAAGSPCSPGRVPRHFGLHVVSALARNWGVTERPDAKTVWAQLPLSNAETVEAEPAHVVVPDPLRLPIEPLTVIDLHPCGGTRIRHDRCVVRRGPGSTKARHAHAAATHSTRPTVLAVRRGPPRR